MGKVVLWLNGDAADSKPAVLVAAVVLRVDDRRAEVQAVSVGSSTMSSRRPPVAAAVILEGTREEVAGAGIMSAAFLSNFFVDFQALKTFP